MKVYRNLEDFEPVHNAVVTQGTFDGLHLGHQQILQRLRQKADQIGGETVLLTFFPHPRMVLQPEDDTLRLLETVEEKIAHMEKEGIDHLLIIPFTRQFSYLSSEEFISDILVRTIRTKVLVIGYDHRFGKNREGSFENLRMLAPQFGFTVEEIPAEDIDAVTISSTKIRNALMQGDVDTAATFLGYHYKVNGTVETGNQKGRLLGFPTANIKPGEWYKLVPGDGVYAVRLHLDGKIFRGMANIGKQPTFENRRHAIEVHIFDFSEDIYNKRVTVEFIQRLRDEQKFSGIEALVKQLEKDKFAARAVLEA